MNPEEVNMIQRAEMTKVNWGVRFRGRSFRDLPSSYLKWIAENFSNDNIATAADIVWQWRERTGSHIDEG
jgi:uncharacterized protein (DUF3820 family)